jgi:hypothetical protein
VVVLVQAQKNKWALPWTENWFYVRLEGKHGLCGKLMRLDSVTSKVIMTDAYATTVNACVKVLPLRADQAWFMVKDDEKYRARRLKGLGVNVRQAWSKVLQKSNKSVAGVKTVYKKVFEAVDKLIRALGT